MNKRCGILIVSVTILVLCFVGTASATNWSVDGSGVADFTGIQDAINNASDGDTIIVHSGVYYENVAVDKSVTLRGIGQPVVDARGWGNAITLTADGITLEGFSITNAGRPFYSGYMISIICPIDSSGIFLDNSRNNKITNNKVIGNTYGGICLDNSSNNTITGNNVCNNNVKGIWLYDSSNNNNITGNNVYNNNWGGINLSFFSNNNTITGNTFVNDGLSVHDSYQNTVEDNTVNDKPLVYLEDVSDYKVEDAGQIILRNCTNITVENLDLSNTSVGIELLNTKDSNILNNTVCNNRGGIGLSYSSNNNTITGNNVNNNNEHGISLYYSSNNTITGNNASNNNDDGIYLDYSSNNTITGSNASNNNDDGINIRDSSNNTITGNNVRNNADGIRLSSSCNNNTITGNTFVNDGLSVHDSYQNTVKNNTVNGKPLVYLKDVSDYKVEDAGQVILVNCNNITVENLVLSNTSVGVHLLKTRNCRISNNTLCNNGEGIYLGDSSNNNTITGNNVSNNNEEGIYLYYSCNNNTITGNTFVNDCLSVYDSYQNTVEDNTVNSKPLVYLEDVSDYKVEDAGQVILVNCNNITVKNLDLSNTSVGVELLNTEDSNILNNTVCNNWKGISLDYSSNNRITGNNVRDNRKGIYLYDSSNNTIYFNNFINNTDNAYSYDASTTIWNSPLEITYTYDGRTYKSYVGNYWDDYKGTDAEGDGIGDTRYNTYYIMFFESDASDDYPLMQPFENYILPTSAPA